MPVQPRPIEERIVSKINAPPSTLGWTARTEYTFPFDPAVCWIWTGAYSKKKGKRYDKGADRPVIQLGRRGTPVVHVLRVMLSLKDGVPLWRRTGFDACHGACQDARCVNPHHGYWGTPGRNRDDRHQYAPETFKRKDQR